MRSGQQLAAEADAETGTPRSSASRSHSISGSSQLPMVSSSQAPHGAPMTTRASNSRGSGKSNGWLGAWKFSGATTLDSAIA